MSVELLPTTIDFARKFMALRDAYAANPTADNYEVYVKAALDAACAMALDVDYAQRLLRARAQL